MIWSKFALLGFFFVLDTCAAFNFRSLIQKWRALHALPKNEADAVIKDVLSLHARSFVLIQREVRLYSTFERVLSRLVGLGRDELVQNLASPLIPNNLNLRKLKAALWSQFPERDATLFLSGFDALLACFPEEEEQEREALIFPLDTEMLAEKLSTDQLCLLVDFIFDYFPEDESVFDLLIEAVEFGHLLPSEYFEMIVEDVDQSKLFARLATEFEEDKEKWLAVAQQFSGHFHATAVVYDAEIDCLLRLPVLFTRFYLQEPQQKAAWSDLFVSAMRPMTTFQDLNVTFRAFCRLPRAPIGVAQNFLKFGAYPLTNDPETGIFPAFNAVLAGNEDLAMFLHENMEISTGMLELIDPCTGVNIIQALL